MKRSPSASSQRAALVESCLLVYSRTFPCHECRARTRCNPRGSRSAGNRSRSRSAGEPPTAECPRALSRSGAHCDVKTTAMADSRHPPRKRPAATLELSSRYWVRLHPRAHRPNTRAAQPLFTTPGSSSRAATSVGLQVERPPPISSICRGRSLVSRRDWVVADSTCSPSCLRALESRVVKRFGRGGAVFRSMCSGGGRPIRLAARGRGGRFREDVYYRIRGERSPCAAARARPAEDIPLFAVHLLPGSASIPRAFPYRGAIESLVATILARQCA